MDIIIKDKFVKKYRGGYPLIQKDAILNLEDLQEEGEIVNLLDKKKNFIAKGYFGRQNKGYGWVLSHKRSVKFDVKFFKDKFTKAKEYREDFFNNKETTCFRFFNGNGDGIGGLSIDYFDGYYLITWYSKGIYKFKDAILTALKEVIDFKGIYHKRRFDTKGQYLQESSDFLDGSKAPEPLIVKENGVKFAIYLDDGAMVGVFLDQRDVRKTILQKYAKDKVVLNTFSYTGAFSIFAALGGAKKTTSVDLAKRSLPKTSEMFSINNIDPKSQEIVVADVFDYFKFAKKKGFSYDVVVVDPPSFARSKKRVFSVAKDYSKLLQEIIAITNKNGVIVASTNYANFDMIHFKKIINKAFRDEGVKYKIEQSFQLPKDFRVNSNLLDDNYLKVVFIRLLK